MVGKWAAPFESDSSNCNRLQSSSKEAHIAVMCAERRRTADCCSSRGSDVVSSSQAGFLGWSASLAGGERPFRSANSCELLHLRSNTVVGSSSPGSSSC